MILMIHKSRLLFGLSLALLLSQYYCSSLIGYAVDDSDVPETTESSSYDRIKETIENLQSTLGSIPVVSNYTEPAIAISYLCLTPIALLSDYYNAHVNNAEYTPGDTYGGIFAYKLAGEDTHAVGAVYPSATVQFSPFFHDSTFRFTFAYSGTFRYYYIFNNLSSDFYIKYYSSPLFDDSHDLTSLELVSFTRGSYDPDFLMINPGGLLYVSGYQSGSLVYPKPSSFPTLVNSQAIFYVDKKYVFPASSFSSDPDKLIPNVIQYVSDTYPDFVSDPLFQQYVTQVLEDIPLPPATELHYNDLEYPGNIPDYTMPTYEMESHSIPESAVSGAGFWFTQLQNFIENSGLMWLVVLVGLLTILFYLLRW